MVKGVKFFTCRVAGAVALVSAASASADTYRYITKDEDNAAIFLDESTVVRHGDVVSYWIMSIDGTYLRGGTPRYAYYLMHQTIDCAGQIMRPTEMSVYAATGVRITSDSRGAEAGPIEPGTIEQQLYDLLCRGVETQSLARMEAETPLQFARRFRTESLKYLRRK